MNRELIEETIRRLKMPEQRFNMADWQVHHWSNINGVDEINWCKTAGCIAGLFGIVKKVNILEGFSPSTNAAILAELDRDWAVSTLFTPSTIIMEEDGTHEHNWCLYKIEKRHAIDALENLLAAGDDYRKLEPADIWKLYCKENPNVWDL